MFQNVSTVSKGKVFIRSLCRSAYETFFKEFFICIWMRLLAFQSVATFQVTSQRCTSSSHLSSMQFFKPSRSDVSSQVISQLCSFHATFRHFCEVWQAVLEVRFLLTRLTVDQNPLDYILLTRFFADQIPADRILSIGCLTTRPL